MGQCSSNDATATQPAGSAASPAIKDLSNVTTVMVSSRQPVSTVVGSQSDSATQQPDDTSSSHGSTLVLSTIDVIAEDGTLHAKGLQARLSTRSPPESQAHSPAANVPQRSSPQMTANNSTSTATPSPQPSRGSLSRPLALLIETEQLEGRQRGKSSPVILQPQLLLSPPQNHTNADGTPQTEVVPLEQITYERRRKRGMSDAKRRSARRSGSYGGPLHVAPQVQTLAQYSSVHSPVNSPPSVVRGSIRNLPGATHQLLRQSTSIVNNGGHSPHLQPAFSRHPTMPQQHLRRTSSEDPVSPLMKALALQHSHSPRHSLAPNTAQSLHHSAPILASLPPTVSELVASQSKFRLSLSPHESFEMFNANTADHAQQHEPQQRRPSNPNLPPLSPLHIPPRDHHNRGEHTRHRSESQPITPTTSILPAEVSSLQQRRSLRMQNIVHRHSLGNGSQHYSPATPSTPVISTSAAVPEGMAPHLAHYYQQLHLPTTPPTADAPQRSNSFSRHNTQHSSQPASPLQNLYSRAFTTSNFSPNNSGPAVNRTLSVPFIGTQSSPQHMPYSPLLSPGSTATLQSLQLDPVNLTQSVYKRLDKTVETHTVEIFLNHQYGKKQINQYVVEGEIGRGSSATVKKVLSLVDHKRYAMKIISKSALVKQHTAGGGGKASMTPLAGSPTNNKYEQAFDGEATAEAKPEHRRIPSSRPHPNDTSVDDWNHILCEIAIMKKFQHPNIVRLYEVLNDETNDNIHLIMEYCELGAVMDEDFFDDMDNVSSSGSSDGTIPASPKQDDALPLHIIQRYFRDTLLALDYLHEHHIAHRDIKPSNMLIGSDGRVRLSDFGVSMLYESNEHEYGDHTRELKGSVAFMAPEMIKSKGQTTYSARAADIWALGVTLFAMVYTCLPFRDNSIAEIYRLIVEAPLQLPTNTRVPPTVQHLLRRMLDKNPNERITMYELFFDEWITDNGKWDLYSLEPQPSAVRNPPPTRSRGASNSNTPNSPTAVSLHRQRTTMPHDLIKELTEDEMQNAVTTVNKLNMVIKMKTRQQRASMARSSSYRVDSSAKSADLLSPSETANLNSSVAG